MKNVTVSSLMTAAIIVLLLAGCGQSSQPDESPDRNSSDSIPSGTYAVDKSHTYLTFSYLHQGLSYPLLRAVEIDGELELDSASMENSSVKVAIAVNSIRTNLDYFDKELASRKFFYAEKFPHITFSSDKYVSTSESAGEMSGFVTIKGVTQPVVLAVQINGAMMHPMMNKPVIGISATGSLNRSDFGLDRFVPAVADEVEVRIEAEFLQGSNDGSKNAVNTATDVLANVDLAVLKASIE